MECSANVRTSHASRSVRPRQLLAQQARRSMLFSAWFSSSWASSPSEMEQWYSSSRRHLEFFVHHVLDTNQAAVASANWVAGWRGGLGDGATGCRRQGNCGQCARGTNKSAAGGGMCSNCGARIMVMKCSRCGTMTGACNQKCAGTRVPTSAGAGQAAMTYTIGRSSIDRTGVAGNWSESPPPWAT